MEKELQQIEKFYNVVVEFLVNYSFQIIGAIIILLIGFWVAKKVHIWVEKFCLSKNFDVTISKFLANFVKLAIIVGAAIIALGKVGITITPFVAAIGAMSLGAGLALQGLLSNYGAGVSIILTRPFVVGNTITTAGVSGLVKEIKFAYTVLETEDGELITIPNKHIVGEILVNSFENKVVETTVGIDYNSDPLKAIEIIKNILNEFDNINKEITPQVGIGQFGDFSINIQLRYWAPTKVYYEILHKVNMRIFEDFKKENINIPYPTYHVMDKK